ncbi:MAG: transcription elongation factor GreB [Gammaproteobacteria bacterium]|nr:transcription elongation factor GreB [Gammaproteobacteria bacterium]
MTKPDDKSKVFRSNYITRAGADTLQEELKYLLKVRRPELTRAVTEAAAHGDRSENAEYIYGKKLLRETDRRIRYLEKRLDALTVVDRLPADQSRVYFGAWVRVEDAMGIEHVYRIVGPDEFDVERGWLSVDSPLAKALLKKQVDDEAIVILPQGRAVYVVLEIAYEFLI